SIFGPHKKHNKQKPSVPLQRLITLPITEYVKKYQAKQATLVLS
ncbi:MAG: hypothetical protein ACI8XV_001192, partial [Arenicella sp.]